MLINIFFCIYLSFLLNITSPTSAGHWISDSRAEKQLNITDDISDESNETVNSFDNITDNASVAVTENDVLFWTKPDLNDTTEEGTVPDTDNQELVLEGALADDENGTLVEEVTEEPEQQGHISTERDVEPIKATELSDKIVLQRLNCDLEMAVDDSHDLKIQIKFSPLQNNTSGKCCLTLNGAQNSVLAVLISGLHLYQNGSDGEVLQVITPNYGYPFVLKEYYNWSKYEPLLLTEAHKVFLVLHYKVTTMSPKEQDSHFDLEVLTYHKYENQIKPNLMDYTPSFSPTKPQYYKFHE